MTQINCNILMNHWSHYESLEPLCVTQINCNILMNHWSHYESLEPLCVTHIVIYL